MTYELYNNKTILNFDEDKHLYTMNGIKVHGTTSILGVIAKPALMYWAVNQAISHLEKCLVPGTSYDEIQLKAMLESAKTAHRKKSTDAADKGKFVHEWCESYIKGEDPKLPVNTELRNAVSKFLEWVNTNNVEFLETEKIVYSQKYNYAGTLDFIAKVNGKIMLGDFKTSTGIYDEYFFQTSAYQQAYLEEYPDKKIEGNIIVRIGKDATLELKESYDYEKNIKAFMGALALYNRIQELKDESYKKKGGGSYENNN